MSANQEMWRFWQTSMQMAVEIPLVVSQRMWLFSQPWDNQTMAEYQLMFTEKAEGFTEAWQTWANVSVYQNQWLLTQPATSQHYEHLIKQSLQSVNQTLKPLSQRVHDNHARLGL
ncbi:MULTISPECIES: hypothetical protein [Vitreoscilla]|uniref:Phasin domain-containing protein n=1 Tax=Vitreoscilla stercoraria TaxID=61 RepID=A0ABY4EDM8_VITST|nr:MULTISPECIES: hypothetical protein [Vitreoscilla]AUZ04801.1 hypothetical protein ADP71_11400 [Vitreoscilla sp. C1]UOO91527.1 hypothetical protein LVJ81_07585 [Vitreoscilla stercoraria]